MRRTGTVAVLALAALAACTTAPGVEKPTGPASPAGRPPATKPPQAVIPPQAQATPQAGATPKATPGAGAQARSVLKPPAGDATRLTGKVKIDAHFALRAGGGSIVSNNGAAVLAFGGAGVISNAGGNMVGDLGASAAAAIRAPGVGLISDAGAGAVPARLRLLADGQPALGDGQPALGDAQPALGEVLPAAGMAVRAFNMGTGALVPLGRDEGGGPVYEVLTDGAGAFTIHVPPGDDVNVLITAEVPGKTDPRLAYALVAPKAAAEQRLDEDTRLVSALIRQATVLQVMGDVNRVSSKLDGTALPDVDTPLVAALDEKLMAAARVSGAWRYDEAKKRVLATRIADALLGRIDFQAVVVPRTGEPALALAATVFGEARVGAAAAMGREAAAGRDPATTFQARDYVQVAYGGKPAPAPIERPSDLVTIVSLHYALRTATVEDFKRILVGADFGLAPQRADDAQVAIAAMVQAAVTSMLTDQRQLDTMFAIIEAGLPADP